MLIAQITDIHIGFEQGNPDELNRVRYSAVLKHLLKSATRPDLLIASGDLTDLADEESYAYLAGTFAACPFPVLPMIGNHDSRAELLHAFPDTPTEGGFIHYVRELEGLRLVLLDTFEPGRHGGAFCEQRRDWLAAELARAPDTPTAIFMHHPPVVSGIDWMDPGAGEEWIAHFAAAVRGHRQVIAIHCGHLHRQVATDFAGIPLSICPSVAPPVALDLRPISAATPDGRELITTEPPVYALHWWDGKRLTSHYQPVSGYDVMARYTAKLQPMIEGMFRERE